MEENPDHFLHKAFSYDIDQFICKFYQKPGNYLTIANLQHRPIGKEIRSLVLYTELNEFQRT